ncbi:MAG: toxin-antitoxin system YwqK family antitoxin [Psychrilyobacter sp.]|nr:toxin-antitoxin system YwqK family antitoxin [Psychrilyobacter sp.]
MRKILTIITSLMIYSFTFAEIIYYPNGNKKQESNYINGTGSYKLYAENGELTQKGYYKNRVLDGKISFYEKGKITGITTYKNNQRNGEYINFYRNGKIKEQGSYINERENGNIITYYENNQIKYSVGYSNGKRDGKTIGYYKNGALKEEGNFSMGHPVGKSTQYYSSGKIHFETDIRGTLTYNGDGSIDIMKTMKSGKVEGTVTEYTKLFNRKIVHKLEKK